MDVDEQTSLWITEMTPFLSGPKERMVASSYDIESAGRQLEDRIIGIGCALVTPSNRTLAPRFRGWLPNITKFDEDCYKTFWRKEIVALLNIAVPSGSTVTEAENDKYLAFAFVSFSRAAYFTCRDFAIEYRPCTDNPGFDQARINELITPFLSQLKRCLLPFTDEVVEITNKKIILDELGRPQPPLPIELTDEKKEDDEEEEKPKYRPHLDTHSMMYGILLMVDYEKFKDMRYGLTKELVNMYSLPATREELLMSHNHVPESDAVSIAAELITCLEIAQGKILLKKDVETTIAKKRKI